jgi:hypothetical protein
MDTGPKLPKLQTSSPKTYMQPTLKASSPKLTGLKLQAASSKPQAASLKLKATSHKLPDP